MKFSRFVIPTKRQGWAFKNNLSGCSRDLFPRLPWNCLRVREFGFIANSCWWVHDAVDVSFSLLCFRQLGVLLVGFRSQAVWDSRASGGRWERSWVWRTSRSHCRHYWKWCIFIGIVTEKWQPFNWTYWLTTLWRTTHGQKEE